jgi:CheY-like chemotaxis protein
VTDRRQVLIVEDDRDLREIFGDVLRDEGWEVATAPDGAAALDLLEDGLEPCVAIIDLRMPRMSGWELVDRLRQREEWRELPFVIVAAHVRVADEAHQIGARWWLQKPVDIDRLVAVVEEAGASCAMAS